MTDLEFFGPLSRIGSFAAISRDIPRQGPLHSVSGGMAEPSTLALKHGGET